MSFTELLQPILRGGIRSVNFFNGRLLSAEDLSAEQAANREGRVRLGQAAGEGVAYGLEVSKAAAGTKESPVVNVSAGLAVNRRGRTLRLDAAVELVLVPQAGDDEAVPLNVTFRDCRESQAGVYVAGAGVYLLTIGAAEGTEGRVPFSGLGSNNDVTCNTRYTVEGVEFRLVKLLESTRLTGDPRSLRNRVAYQCFGVEELRAFGAQPFAGPLRQYGLLDEKRPNVLTDDETPLALVYWTPGGGVEFIDLWSVRRRLTAASAGERWAPLAGDRRLSEAEAMLLQFQEQAAALQQATDADKVNKLKADEHFAYLPPAGLLQTGGARPFDWKTFLGPYAPPEATVVDEALLRSVIQNSFHQDAVKLTRFTDAARYNVSPPAPLTVYTLASAADFVLFARSSRGRIRVFVTPAGTPVGAGEIFAETDRTNVRLYATVPAGAQSSYPVVEAEPGVYSVSLDAENLLTETRPGVGVVAGRTSDVLFTVTVPGHIEVTIVNQANRDNQLDDEVQSVRATPTQGGTSYAGVPGSGGKWRISDLPAGEYMVSVAAAGFQPGQATGVRVVVGQTTGVTVEVAPVPVVTGSIKLEVKDKATGAVMNAAVQSVSATNQQSGQSKTGTEGADDIWHVTDLVPATYTLTVTAPNYHVETVSGVPVEAGKVREITVLMRAQPGTIRVQVRDARSGASLNHVVERVTVASGANSYPATKDSLNNWAVAVPPGTYTVTAVTPNFQTGTASNVQLASNTIVDAPVTVSPLTGRLSLTVERLRNFGNALTAVVTPPGASVAFVNDFCQITGVPAGPVNVNITSPNTTYPNTSFNLLMPPNGNESRKIYLTSLGVIYVLGGSHPRKPHTTYTWRINPKIVESPPAAPWGNMTPWTPGRDDIEGWLATWRNWLVLTRPDLSIDINRVPQLAMTLVSPSSGPDEHGRAIFYRTNGAKVGMPVTLDKLTEVGEYEPPDDEPPQLPPFDDGPLDQHELP